MKLKIAIQKSGRLFDDSVQLLKDCGIDLKTNGNKLRAESDNFPMEIYFLRDDDIPQYVEDSVADIGIVGRMSSMRRIRRLIWSSGLGSGNAGYPWRSAGVNPMKGWAGSRVGGSLRPIRCWFGN